MDRDREDSFLDNVTSCSIFRWCLTDVCKKKHIEWKYKTLLKKIK